MQQAIKHLIFYYSTSLAKVPSAFSDTEQSEQTTSHGTNLKKKNVPTNRLQILREISMSTIDVCCNYTTSQWLTVPRTNLIDDTKRQIQKRHKTKKKQQLKSVMLIKPFRSLFKWQTIHVLSPFKGIAPKVEDVWVAVRSAHLLFSTWAYSTWHYWTEWQ